MSNNILRKYIDIIDEAAMGVKISKEDANYTDYAMGISKCRICKHFQGPNQCEIVEGIISPNGWCKHFGSFVL